MSRDTYKHILYEKNEEDKAYVKGWVVRILDDVAEEYEKQKNLLLKGPGERNASFTFNQHVPSSQTESSHLKSLWEKIRVQVKAELENTLGATDISRGNFPTYQIPLVEEKEDKKSEPRCYPIPPRAEYDYTP